VVGDGHNDILVAKALCCRSVGVTYGFGEAESLRTLKPTVMTDNFVEAIAAVQGWMEAESKVE
jgi:phosphoglycolate phosphatase-like HAD superfamily hydrolase